MGAAEQCYEFVWLQRRVERKEAVVGQLGGICVEPLTDEERWCMRLEISRRYWGARTGGGD